jgi:hypothetical protein
MFGFKKFRDLAHKVQVLESELRTTNYRLDRARLTLDSILAHDVATRWQLGRQYSTSGIDYMGIALTRQPVSAIPVEKAKR